ncbi:MAG: chemotaxis protein CheC [Deltaproteobacteria bacterium]|nr:chemotaxis protein CheC [Deltaproteobacteria bacterium]
MSNEERLSDKELDYLREMMNIGAGNAATALSQMLGCRMKLDIPRVHQLPAKRVSSVVGVNGLPVVCVKMSMVGDCKGEIFFVVPENARTELARMAERALLGDALRGTADTSTLEEIGNIMAGSYLTAIHDFCKLNLYHSVPVAVIDVFQSIIDELLASFNLRADSFIVIENEFAIVIESEVAAEERQTRVFFILFPSVESAKSLVESFKNAMPE